MLRRRDANQASNRPHPSSGLGVHGLLTTLHGPSSDHQASSYQPDEFYFFICLCIHFKTRSYSTAPVDLKITVGQAGPSNWLAIFLPQPPEGWDYPMSGMILNCFINSSWAMILFIFRCVCGVCMCVSVVCHGTQMEVWRQPEVLGVGVHCCTGQLLFQELLKSLFLQYGWF